MSDDDESTARSDDAALPDDAALSDDAAADDDAADAEDAALSDDAADADDAALSDDAADADEDLESIVVEETDLEDGQLAYDCTAWAGESRGMLTSLLSTAGIAHAWQGTVLTVREEDEEAIDDLVDEVLAAARPALDPSAARLVYEVGTWPVALQTELVDALTASDVAYEWDERGDLVVLESDEEVVAEVLADLPDPDDDQVSSDDGVAVHELLDRVFMAADRLARNGADAQGTVQLVDAADVLGRLALPFGFEPAQWRRLVSEVTALSDAIDPSPSEGDDAAPLTAASDSDIAEQAASVRQQLRQYI